jgi:hypothetical protein
MNKKILIVSAVFHPQNSPRANRTTELVKEFAREGHDVTLISPKNNKIHTVLEKKYAFTFKDLGKNNFNEIDLNSKNKFILFFKRFLRRGFNLFLDYPNIGWMYLVKKILKNENGYDLLISIATPHPIHWGTALVHSKRNKIAKVWVADCGDPFMGITTDTFRKPFYFKYLEKYWSRKADYISVPFAGAKDGYYKEFHSKIKVIPQGFNFNEIKIDQKEFVPNLVPTFAYAGGFISGARDPYPLIDFLLNLGIDFKFIIYTNSVLFVKDLVYKSKGKVEVKSYIPRLELIEVLSKMDFILNINNGVSTQLPSKLIDYLIAKRPILSIDSYSFEKSIVRQFLSGDYSNMYIFNNPEQYKIENVCKAFLKLS